MTVASSPWRRFSHQSISAILAVVGVFLFASSLGENISSRRIVIELSLTLPLIMSIAWDLVARAARSKVQPRFRLKRKPKHSRPPIRQSIK